MQQVAEHWITYALAALMPALVAYLTAWLRARTAIQEQAVRGAVAEMAAAVEPAAAFSKSDMRAEAIARALERLPRSHGLHVDKLGDLVEHEVRARKAQQHGRASRPPSSERATVPDREEVLPPNGKTPRH